MISENLAGMLQGVLRLFEYIEYGSTHNLNHSIYSLQNTPCNAISKQGIFCCTQKSQSLTNFPMLFDKSIHTTCI